MDRKQISVSGDQMRVILNHAFVFCQKGCKQHGRHAVKLFLDHHDHTPWLVMFCRGHFSTSINMKSHYNSLSKTEVDLTEYPELVQTFQELCEIVAKALPVSNKIAIE